MDDIGNAADTAHGTTQRPGPLGDLSLPQLEDRLGYVAAHIAASECEFLDLLAEFDAREGWGESGMRSTAHWLSWRVGLHLGVAREKVRVARALRRLPLVHEAFAAGSLSYCKVRALSRVATPTTEADLVEIARGATGAQLEAVVKGWRRILVGEMSASAHIRRGVRRRIDDDGSHVYTIRVPPEVGPVFDNALDMARRVVLDDDGNVVETPEEEKLAEHLTEDPPVVRADADALLLIMESFLADGPRGEAGDRHLVIVHTDIDALADVCRRQKPPDVSAEASSDPPVGGPTAQQPVGVSAETSASVSADPVPRGASVHQVSRVRRPATCTTEDGHPISASTVMRMLCESQAQLLVSARDGRPLDLGRTSRNADRRQRRALRVRDGGCCRFPGCTQRRRLVPHHSHWWSRQGPTDIDLLVSLCPTHHRAVHELGYDVRALGRGRFAFARPSGEAISEVAQPPGLPFVDEACTRGWRTSAAGATVAPVVGCTIAPTWGGERIDLDHLLTGMAANLLIRDGQRLTDIPYPESGSTLRRAVGWPQADPAVPGPFSGPAAA